MGRAENSPWAIPVAQIASRAGQSHHIDAVFPAPSGIGDDVIGVKEDADVNVGGSIDSIVDGLIATLRISAPVHAQCTRCLTPIKRDWVANTTVFFPYDSQASDQGDWGGGAEIEIVAGEDESEDTYPLSADGAFVDIEALLRDTLVEELPMQPLCRPDCRGLCPQCGLNLNEHPGHRHDATDMRFDALKALKEQLENGASQS